MKEGLTFGKSDDMHPQLESVEGCPSHQVGAEWVLLGQIRSEIHLFPLVPLFDVLVSGEPELPQMPAPDEVQLPSLHKDDE